MTLHMCKGLPDTPSLPSKTMNSRSDTEEPERSEFPVVSSSDNNAPPSAEAKRMEVNLELSKGRSQTQSSHTYEPVVITTDTDGEVCIEVEASVAPDASGNGNDGET